MMPSYPIRLLGLRVLLLGAALLGASMHVAPARSEEPAQVPTPAELVAAFAEGPVERRTAVEAEIRQRGTACVAALRALQEKAAAALQVRLTRLLGRIEVDWQRAHVPRGMVYIPAGALEVPRVRRPWGPSGKRVRVPAFYMDKTEVTVGAWTAWLRQLREGGESPALLRALWQPPNELAGHLPAIRVTWQQARDYARRRRAGRLPRAEEFERALRGSGVSYWPWGDAPPEGRANLRTIGPGHVVPVGSLKEGRSAFGVYDLVGNVAEWSATEVRQGEVGRYPLVLGGSFRSRVGTALTWRGLDRMQARIGPSEKRDHVGFRVVREVKPLP